MCTFKKFDKTLVSAHKLSTLLSLVALIAVAFSYPADAQSGNSGTVKTDIVPIHRLSSAAVVPQAGASLLRNNKGVLGTISTSVTAGHVTTFSGSIFNNPFFRPIHVVAQQEISDNAVLNWTIAGSGLDVRSGQSYTLVNETLKKSIRYGHRGSMGGINLVWDSSTNLTNFTIKSEGPSGSPIRYGDRVAISVQGINKPYLRYEHRTIGINLDWSASPIYEWIVAGGPKGTVVKTKTQVALFNTVEKDFMIYAKRGGEAINLRWYLDRNNGGYLDAAKRIAGKKGFEYLVEYLTK